MKIRLYISGDENEMNIELQTSQACHEYFALDKATRMLNKAMAQLSIELVKKQGKFAGSFPVKIHETHSPFLEEEF